MSFLVFWLASFLMEPTAIPVSWSVMSFIFLAADKIFTFLPVFRDFIIPCLFVVFFVFVLLQFIWLPGPVCL